MGFKEFVKEIYNFDNFLAPRLIAICWWIIFSAMILGTVVTVIISLFTEGLGQALLLLFVAILSMVGLRVLFEAYILFFRIYDKLDKISCKK